MDEFVVVCVDRIMSSTACFQEPRPRPSSGNSERIQRKEENVNKDGILKPNGGEESSFSSEKGKGSVRECRICQEEDEEKDMDAPCACNGTLKFAHRKCIQGWCNAKGDITCEICNQVFSPNYTCPQPRNDVDVMTIDVRQAWGAHIDLGDNHVLDFAAAEHRYWESEYYSMANGGIFACFRSITIILMLLLLIGQTLMVARDFGMLQGSSASFRFQMFILQLAGFLLPSYVLAHSWYTDQFRRRRRG